MKKNAFVEALTVKGLKIQENVITPVVISTYS